MTTVLGEKPMLVDNLEVANKGIVRKTDRGVGRDTVSRIPLVKMKNARPKLKARAKVDIESQPMRGLPAT